MVTTMIGDKVISFFKDEASFRRLYNAPDGSQTSNLDRRKAEKGRRFWKVREYV